MSETPPVPYVTVTVALAIIATAWLVTGFFPDEASLRAVWWDEESLARGEWWRALTAIFAHGGLLHLVFNLLALLSFGPLVERRIGSLRFAGLYFGAGFASLFAHALYRPGLPVVGASGAIFGILGILIILAPRARMTLFFFWETTILMFGALYAAIVPVLLQIGAGSIIAHEAHLGGMFFGIAWAFFVDWRKSVRVLPAAAVVFIAVTLLVTAWTRLLRTAQCPFFPDPLAWAGCVLVAFWSDAWLVVGSIIGVFSIAAAYTYLERAKA
jgi:membrane associated rhomboid family serine protease